MKNRCAFSFVEILISTLIFSILVIATILLLDPRTLVNKGIDTKRKSELNAFKKILEEFYNDKGCYPKLSEVCYSTGQDLTRTSCIMCGNEPSSPLLPLVPSYMDTIPCDPTHRTTTYLYAISSGAGTVEKACPKSYAVYAKLGVPQDADSIKLGCYEGGCGPGYGYDYAISSPNSGPIKTNAWQCNQSGSCDSCTNFPGYPNPSYEACLHNTNCIGGIYATHDACILANPGAR